MSGRVRLDSQIKAVLPHEFKMTETKLVLSLSLSMLASPSHSFSSKSQRDSIKRQVGEIGARALWPHLPTRTITIITVEKKQR